MLKLVFDQSLYLIELSFNYVESLCREEQNSSSQLTRVLPT